MLMINIFHNELIIKETNMLYTNKNKSTIKSMIFSGLLAFGIMGVNDGFSSNYVKNIFDICEQYKGNTIDKEQNVKNNIIGILNHKVGNQTFYDFFTLPADKLITKCSETNVDKIVEKAFADGDFTLVTCGSCPRFSNGVLHLDFFCIRGDNCIEVNIVSFSEPYNGTSRTHYSYSYSITKQPNGEYKFKELL